jgi:hypothetical protein
MEEVIRAEPGLRSIWLIKPWKSNQIENGILGGDVEVREFWYSVAGAKWIAVGRTPNDALAALKAKQDVPNPHSGPGAIILKKIGPQ